MALCAGVPLSKHSFIHVLLTGSQEITYGCQFPFSLCAGKHTSSSLTVISGEGPGHRCGGQVIQAAGSSDVDKEIVI